MRLLILGAGGIGGYFGSRLAAAGVDVTFLVRPNRAERLSRDGLVIISPLGDHMAKVGVATAARPGFDAVVLACKAFDLESAMQAITPAVTAGTLVLPLLNGLRHLDRLDERFGAATVIGGLAHIGVTLREDGAILHLNRLQRLAFGPRMPGQQDACERLYAVLSRGGFAPELSAAILQEMWEKFVLLVTYAGMTCLMRGDIGSIMAAASGETAMRQAFAECASVAAAAGWPVRSHFEAETLAMLTDRTSHGTASMLRDVIRGAATEHDHILGDMLHRARLFDLSAPMLTLSLAHMQVYEAGRLRLPGAERKAGSST